jgi:putative oxidoreductase
MAMQETTGQARLERNARSLYADMERLSPYVLSILRVVVALVFLQYGLSKLIGFPEAGPPRQGLIFVAAILESVGGVMLIAGVFTRIVAFILCGEMAVAYFMVHAPNGFYPILNHGDAAILFCFVFLYVAFAGGGPWTADRIILKQD